MTEGYGGSPEALADHVRRAEGRVTQARYTYDQAAAQARQWTEDARLAMPCPYCGQGPGEWCVTVTHRRRAGWMHEARGRILREHAHVLRSMDRAWHDLTTAQRTLTAARSTP